MSATATSYNPSYRYGEAKPRRFPFVAAGGAGAPAGSGVAVNVGDFCFSSGPTRVVADGVTNTDTSLVSATALFTPGDVGAAVTGTGIPASTTIASVTSSTTVVLSQATTATGTGVSVTIAPAQAASVYPAMSYPWTTNLATTQANFVKQCVGVSGQAFDGANANAYGIQDGTLRIDTGGVYDFACASATFNVGDIVGLAKDAGGNFLAGQTVVLVTAVANAIARVVQPYPNATTVVRCEIFSPGMSLVNSGQV